MQQKPQFNFFNHFLSGETRLAFWGYVKKGVGILNSFFILRSLTLYQFGVYQLLLTIYASVSDIFHDLFGRVVSNDVARLVGEGKEAEAKKLYKEYAIFRVAMSFIPLIAVYFIEPIAAGRYGYEAILWTRILAILFIVDALTALMVFVLNVRLEFRVLSFRPTLQKVIQAGILAYFYFTGQLQVTQVFLAQTAAPAIMLLLFMKPYLRAYLPWKKVEAVKDGMLWKVVSTYGKWEIPQIFIRDLSSKVRPFLIKLFINTEAVGIFGIASTAISLLKDVLPMRTLTSLVPRKAHDRSYLNYLFVYGTKYYTLMALMLCVVGAIGFPISVKILFPQYTPAIPLFYIMLPAVVIFAFTKMMSILLLVKRRQRFFFFQSIAENTAAIVALLVFLPWWGIIGLAVATILSDLVVDISRYLYLVRTKFIDPFPYSKLLHFEEADRQLLEKGRVYVRQFINRRIFRRI